MGVRTCMHVHVCVSFVNKSFNVNSVMEDCTHNYIHFVGLCIIMHVSTSSSILTIPTHLFGESIY